MNRRHLLASPMLLGACLAGCASGTSGTLSIPAPPAITISAAGITTAPPAPVPASAIGTLLAQYRADLVAASAEAHSPSVDTIGVNFFTALTALDTFLAAQSPITVPGACGAPVCVLSLVEGLRQASTAGPNTLSTILEQVVSTGNVYIADTRAKGIAVGANVIGLVTTIEQQFTAGVIL